MGQNFKIANCPSVCLPGPFQESQISKQVKNGLKTGLVNVAFLCNTSGACANTTLRVGNDAQRLSAMASAMRDTDSAQRDRRRLETMKGQLCELSSAQSAISIGQARAARMFICRDDACVPSERGSSN